MTDYVEQPLDNNDDYSVLTLVAENGEKIEFERIACIALRGTLYLILKPLQLLDGMSEDEAFVFKTHQDRNGEDRYDIELDEDVIDQVFEEYYRLLDEQE